MKAIVEKKAKMNLRKLVKEEVRIINRYIAVSDYFSANYSEQYAYLKLFKNGIRVKVSTKACDDPTVICFRLDDRQMNQMGLRFPYEILSAYGLSKCCTVSRYRTGRFSFWIDQECIKQPEMSFYPAKDIRVEKPLENPICLVKNDDGEISLNELGLSNQQIISFDITDRMVMSIEDVSRYEQEEFFRYIKLCRYYGAKMQYLPYTKLTFSTGRNNAIPKKIVDLFGGSLDCYKTENGFIATPVHFTCPLTNVSVDYTEEKPERIYVSKESEENLPRAAEIVKLLMSIEQENQQLKRELEAVKMSQETTHREILAYRKFIKAKGENPDNILLARL